MVGRGYSVQNKQFMYCAKFLRSRHFVLQSLCPCLYMRQCQVLVCRFSVVTLSIQSSNLERSVICVVFLTCTESGIEMSCLHPHNISVLKPLDRTVFESIKTNRHNNNNNNNNNNKLTERFPTTNQTLQSVIMKREHVC